MLKGAYADDFYNILLKVVHHSRLTFICSIPIWMKEKFIKETGKKFDFLSSNGVISIIIEGIEIMIENPDYISGES